MPMTSGDVARRAAELVGGDRQRTHGDKKANHACIAAVWNGLLAARRVAGKPEALDAHDVANLMEALKIARRYTGSFNEDDYVDGAGYAAVAIECYEAPKADEEAGDSRQPQAETAEETGG